MNILKKLTNILSSSSHPKTDRATYLFVQCNKCGEKLRARVDVWNELTSEYDGQSDDPASYFCRKVLVGEKMCYQPIELRLNFDKNHRLVEKTIIGGKYIDEAEFSCSD
jgi:hypothetical protein